MMLFVTLRFRATSISLTAAHRRSPPFDHRRLRLQVESMAQRRLLPEGDYAPTMKPNFVLTGIRNVTSSQTVGEGRGHQRGGGLLCASASMTTTAPLTGHPPSSAPPTPAHAGASPAVSKRRASDAKRPMAPAISPSAPPPAKRSAGDASTADEGGSRGMATAPTTPGTSTAAPSALATPQATSGGRSPAGIAKSASSMSASQQDSALDAQLAKIMEEATSTQMPRRPQSRASLLPRTSATGSPPVLQPADGSNGRGPRQQPPQHGSSRLGRAEHSAAAGEGPTHRPQRVASAPTPHGTGALASRAAASRSAGGYGRHSRNAGDGSRDNHIYEEETAQSAASATEYGSERPHSTGPPLLRQSGQRPGSAQASASGGGGGASRSSSAAGHNMGLPADDLQDMLSQTAVTYDDPGRLARQELLARLEYGDNWREHVKEANGGVVQPLAVSRLRHEGRAEGAGEGHGGAGGGEASGRGRASPQLGGVRSGSTGGDATRTTGATVPVTPSARPASTAVFMATGLSEEQKSTMRDVMVRLGARVESGTHYEPTVTHLIVGSPQRTEKYLASCAAGRWVLRYEYVHACLNHGCLLPEEAYEWSESDCKRPSSASKRTHGGGSSKSQSPVLYAAPRRWRERLAKLGPTASAFHGWGVVLCAKGMTRDGFARLLVAGGARVLGMEQPSGPLPSGTTHVVRDSPKTGDPALWDAMAALPEVRDGSVLCVRCEFISDTLLEPKPIEVGQYLFISPEAGEAAQPADDKALDGREAKRARRRSSSGGGGGSSSGGKKAGGDATRAALAEEPNNSSSARRSRRSSSRR